MAQGKESTALLQTVFAVNVEEENNNNYMPAVERSSSSRCRRVVFQTWTTTSKARALHINREKVEMSNQRVRWTFVARRKKGRGRSFLELRSSTCLMQLDATSAH